MDPSIETIDSGIDETAPPQRSPLAAALPFRERTHQPNAPIPMVVPPLPPPLSGAPVVPERPAESADDRTAMPQRSPIAAALPFREKRAAAHDAATAKTAAFEMTPEALNALLANAQSAAQAPSQGASRSAQSPAPASPAPPPAAPLAPQAPSIHGMTVEQYAGLCAELAAFPQQSEAAFTRYGLTSAPARAAADQAWRAALAQSPDLYREWQRLYQQYQTYYQQRRSR